MKEKPLSLAPLKFDEAIAELLKIKPMPKAPKKPKPVRGQAQRKTKRVRKTS